MSKPHSLSWLLIFINPKCLLVNNNGISTAHWKPPTSCLCWIVPRIVWFSLEMKAHSTRRLRDFAKRKTPQIYTTLNVVNMGTDDTIYVCVKLEILRDGLTLPQNNKACSYMYFSAISKTITGQYLTTQSPPGLIRTFLVRTQRFKIIWRRLFIFNNKLWYCPYTSDGTIKDVS